MATITTDRAGRIKYAGAAASAYAVGQRSGVVLYYSYSTIIGFTQPNGRGFVTAQKYSTTTSKHSRKAADHMPCVPRELDAPTFAAQLAYAEGGNAHDCVRAYRRGAPNGVPTPDQLGDWQAIPSLPIPQALDYLGDRGEDNGALASFLRDLIARA